MSTKENVAFITPTSDRIHEDKKNMKQSNSLFCVIAKQWTQMILTFTTFVDVTVSPNVKFVSMTL
jgi:hypothetical protein